MELFGSYKGENVYRVVLRNGELSASIISWGASLQSLHFSDVPHSLVLGFDTLNHYVTHGAYFGATVGRFANRIALGKVTLDGIRIQLNANDGGKHCLHGGSEGFGLRNWKFTDMQNNQATLNLKSPDGEMGFPGALDVKMNIVLTEGNTLVISYEAVCDQPTLCNLAHHSYFNLDGSNDVRSHSLEIQATKQLVVGEENIPTGEVKELAHPTVDISQPIDSCFCFDDGFLKKLAILKGRYLGMRIRSTELGLQVYNGENIPDAAFSGIALEPQGWPDSPNHTHFPQAWLHPGEKYHQQSEFEIFRTL